MCVIYGLIIKIEEEVVLIDGGSALWAGVGIKMKLPKIKTIYLDTDPNIFKSQNANIIKNGMEVCL